MNAHSEEVVKQLADIDPFRVKWRSRKQTHTLSSQTESACFHIHLPHIYKVHACIHAQTHTSRTCNDCS